VKDEDRKGNSRRDLLEDFVSRFQEIVRSPIDPSGVYETGESIDLVWKTDWVAISLIRRLTFPISLSILAEISMPVLTSDNDSSRHTALPDDVILQMEYLRTLLVAGFDLQVIGEECLWVASKDFKEIPPLEILEILMPPGPNVQSSQLTDQNHASRNP
jgi:hypothetical protein